MIRVSNLRIGQHVLVGMCYEKFNVPKHLAVITQLGFDKVVCSSGDDTEAVWYKEEDMDGLPIEPSILEAAGFVKSRMHEDRWIYVSQDDKGRVVYNRYSATITANNERIVEMSDVRYMHELESVIADAGIEINFDFM